MLARLHERQNWRYFSVQFERRKVDIKANWKLKHANSILETFEYVCQLPHIIKIDLCNCELYRFKVGAFLRHSVVSRSAWFAGGYI